MLTTPTRINERTTAKLGHDTDTVLTARGRPGATHDNTALWQLVTQLRGELCAAADDNARLQRKLDRARAENRQLRRELARQPNRLAGVEYVRRALTEPWSRNP